MTTDHYKNILFQISFRLKEIYTDLVQLGHPNFSTTGQELKLICSESLESATKKEESLKVELDRWKKDVQNLKEKYQWLLFFHLPKMKRLHELIIADDPSAVDIFNEVSFLCARDATFFEHVQERLKVCNKILSCIK